MTRARRIGLAAMLGAEVAWRNYVSELGDCRERACPCRGCGKATWRLDAFCEACADDVLELTS